MYTNRSFARCISNALVFAALAIGVASQAFAAAIIIDNYSGTRVGTRTFVGNQGGGTGTAPTFTESGGGGAIRLTPGNSIVSGTLTYTPASTLDLTGGGTNDQFLVEFISVIADNGLPLQGLSNLQITVNTTTGARQKSGLGITNGQGNIAIPFSTFTGTANFNAVTSIVLAFFSQTNNSSGNGTITLDRVWASPAAGAVPTPPVASFTSLLGSTATATPINYTLAFSNNQGAAPITGLASGDITVSGTAGATTATITGVGSSYNVAVSGMTADGTVIVTLGANTITDLWLQANPAGATSATVNYVRPPVFTNGPPPNTATVGTPYSFTYTATGQAPITFSTFSGALPTGLTMTSAGAITGTPTSPSVFSGVTRATNVGSTNQNFSITVTCPTLSVTPTILPPGTVGTPYLASLGTTGATGSFVYTVTAGTLPPGLTQQSGGLLVGTPTGAGGISNFTITSTGPNGGNCTATRAYSMSVIGPFTVTPSVTSGGAIAPSTPVAVLPGGTTSFTVTPPNGFATSVGGTCGGTLTGNVFTTNAVNANCTVAASFVPLITYNVVLEGAQETPPNSAVGAGSGTAVVNTVANTITLNLNFSGTTGALTGAHLHGPAARGGAAPVKITIGLTSPITNVATYLEADEADVVGGLWYVNLHTAAFPGGELRGQLDNLGPAQKTLSVVLAGNGGGLVTGTGINCPGDCTETVAHNSVIVLTAAAAVSSTFTGWSGGGCTGTGTCSVTMNALKTVTATFAQLVNPTTTLASSLNPSKAGQSVTLTASVSGGAGTPTGRVVFSDGGNEIAGCASVALSSGTAQCVTSALALGTRSITAQYLGNATYNPSTSGTLIQTVNANTFTPGSILFFLFD